MGLHPMGLHHPASGRTGVFRLALTLFLALGSIPHALSDDLIPDDIAFTQPPAEQQPSATTESDTKEIAANQNSTVENLADDNGGFSEVAATPPDTSDNTTPATAITAPVTKPEQHCSQNPTLYKSLTIGSFTRLDPKAANAGNLYEAEQGIAQLFSHHLRSHPVINPQLLPQGMHHAMDENKQQLQAQKIARKMGTQFVLQGFIADMSMDNPDSLYNPGLYRKAANLFHDLSGIQAHEKRHRHFALNMELRDGYTGEVLLEKTYRTSGIWSVRKPVGFNSAAFRNSDYAQQIDKLVKQASGELAKTIACQPFMVSIDAAPGRAQLLLAGGANNGLHAGDQLELYQLILSPSNTEYMRTETRLVKRNTRVQLHEVYPSHSTAVLPDGEYLNGMFLAVSD